MPTTVPLNALLLLMTGVLLNAAAQLLLKKGMTTIGYFSFSWDNFLPIAQQVAINPYIMIGIVSYIFSLIAWLLVLSRLPVSYAYPMLSIGYIVVAIVGYYLFQEPLTAHRILGILIIVAGIYLLNRN